MSRRSSGKRRLGGDSDPPTEWTPEAISGLFGWWRADSSDITIATGVSAWVDRVNGHTIAQATGANQPSFTQFDANLNNRGSVTFDGSNDYLTSNEAASVWNFLHEGSSAVYVVARHTAAQTGWFLSTAQTISVSAAYSYAWGVDASHNNVTYICRNDVGFYVAGATPVAASIMALNTTKRMSLRTVLNTSVKVQSDTYSETACTRSGSQASGTARNPMAMGFGGPGWGQSFQGQIAAMLIYNTAVSDSDHALICDYLDSYYGI